ncbi:hypothetical protein D9619_003945 [Psilocybe cf. subviscida]|uniref:Uncharacterized protein n=1 Tax=Psilocybe cf. subviscida TaxID=2480587 RepID=A0A8H5F7N2_9AGAR|nr:hypothetical protein D9619_003945 [Psilocybe cf. subviscida]
MLPCDDAGPLDVLDTCVRDTWAAALPVAVVLVLLLASIPWPAVLSQALGIVGAISDPFLTLREAEALESLDSDNGAPAVAVDDKAMITGWRQIILVSIAVLQFLCSTGVAGWLLSVRDGDSSLTWRGTCALIIAFSWLYAAACLILSSKKARSAFPYDLFMLILVFLVGAMLKLGGVVYDHIVFGFEYPPRLRMVMLIANVVSVAGAIGILLATPIGYPSHVVDPKDIGVRVSPEDYVVLWRWLTFSWMSPLMNLGKRITLQQKDVWNLSPSMRAHPVFTKFGTIVQSSLLRRLFVQNARDLSFDALLTLATTLSTYAGPFFLKHILDVIDNKHSTMETRGNAYVFAFLALLCTGLKTQAEMLHLWFSRRASIRLRQALMAAIYDKSLKRKDFSGVVNKDDQGEKATVPGAKTSKAQAAANKKNDNPKAGADIGKIVNLMSSDCNRLSFVISTLNMVYGAPFEIIIAIVFLYQLLGWSAFAGFSVTLIIWPVNTYLTRRRLQITKKHTNAIDKRMGVLNELIAAIKLIKFYGWEEKWIGKVDKARADELEMLVATRINSVLINAIWTIAPVMVSVGSFYAYVMSGHDLTIGKAFTALALFNMVKDPVRGIPSSILRLTQGAVSLKRIEVYLNEDEVDGQVSSLKTRTASSGQNVPADGLGLNNATLTWNSVTEAIESSHSRKQLTAQADGNVDEVLSSDASQPEINEDRLFELQDITVMFPERKMTVIMGPTASGKTALLMALLGEMTLLKGEIIMAKDTSRVDEYALTSSISYAAQTPWLRHQSIRDNILFGSPYNEQRYYQVLECCALNPDLNTLEDGDSTEIGARGINLSGGQKARVALARAVYARTKYVLLDDPLSAVDSHTARHLFDNLLTGPLLANRTVILVTHHIELVLPGTNYLVKMLDGRVDVQGSVEDLKSLGVLDDLIYKSDEQAKNLQTDMAEEAAVEGSTKDDKSTTPAAAAVSQDPVAKKPKKLVKDEHREVGGVKWKVYKTYLRASSYWTWVIIVTFTVILQLLTLGNKLWIRIWGDAYTSSSVPELQSYSDNSLYALSLSQTPLRHSAVTPWNWPDASVHPLFYVGIYAGIGLATALAINIAGITQYTGALRASRLLFGQLLRSVVRATFRFHDTTPQGRILNRFGQDIQMIDTDLAASLQSVNSSMADFFTSVVTIVVVFPPLVLPALIIGYIYRELAAAYLRTGRDIRRMMSNSRSPIYSDFGELLEGIVTVRAFSAEIRFLENLYVRLDVYTKFWYFFWMTNRWLMINYDMLGGFSILVTSLFSIYKLNNDAGLAGLCITSAMSFTRSIYWASRNWTGDAVERIIEYLGIPQEQPAVVESNRVPAYWPSRSSPNPILVLDNVNVKYAEDLPAVLQNVSLQLKAGERVGLLGRTGSGKSTLAMSILRFVDPSNGCIFIDGIDISTIGTYDLRSRLTFIPQDATLFSGTLRENLNPFGEYTDAECIDVLCRVGLIDPEVVTEPTSDSETTSTSEIVDAVRGSSSQSLETRSTQTQVERDSNKPIITLDTKIAAGGLNMSQGQRQLIAMARALLRNSSIIILDEATSSIDFTTDAKIQKVIREGFTESLLLTIAHRLHTVIDYDRLIVLDKGKVVEFDTPWNLIHKDNGVFKDISPPPDYYAPHSATSYVSPEAALAPGKNSKPSKEPNTSTGAASLNRVPQGAPQDEDSSFTVLPEPGSLPVIGSNGNSSTSASGTRDMKPKAKIDSSPAAEVGLTPLSPVRRQPEASSSSGSILAHAPSHHQKSSSKSSSRASMIFRTFAHSPSASSSSLLDNTPTKLEPEPFSRSPTPGQSSDGGRYPLPANVANILSHLDPPAASRKPHPTSSSTQPHNHLPYTSPYAKHTNGASVSYILSSLAPVRDRPSRRSSSKEAHSASNTQTSLSRSVTSVSTGGSQGSSSKSRSRSRQERKLADGSASRSASLELDSGASRPVSPTSVTTLVSSLFAPLAHLPPLAPMSMSSSSSLTPSVPGHHLDAPTESHTNQMNLPSTAPATQRVAAVSNLLGGLGPVLPAPSSKSAKPGSNTSGSRQQKEQKHQKNTSHVSESVSSSKLPNSVSASVSALSMLNPSNLLRPSMDVKPRPFDSSPAASSSSPTPSYAHERLGSSISRNGITPSTNASRNQPSQSSTPSTSAAAGWTNPLLALDSKLKPPAPKAAKSRVGEPSQAHAQSQTPSHSHLNALTPNSKPNQSSKPRPVDSAAKARGTSSTRAETGGRNGGAFSRLGSMFGSSKG